jgi:hypothetical protein
MGVAMGKKPAKKAAESKGKKAAARVKKQSRKRRIRNPRKQRKSRLKKDLKNIPAGQGIAEKHAPVGYGRPPEDHQYQPGQSGNPAGCPPSRTNLWRYFCQFMMMTPGQLAKVRARKDKADLLKVEELALKAVDQAVKRGIGGTGWLLIREVWNRDEGKPSEHLTIERPEAMTDEECEDSRRRQREAFDRMEINAARRDE